MDLQRIIRVLNQLDRYCTEFGYKHPTETDKMTIAVTLSQGEPFDWLTSDKNTLSNWRWIKMDPTGEKFAAHVILMSKVVCMQETAWLQNIIDTAMEEEAIADQLSPNMG